jgi:hypothetical protein
VLGIWGLLAANSVRVSAQVVVTSTSQQTGPAQQMDAAALFELGISLVRSKRFEQALHAFDLAYRLAPHPDVLFNLALVQVELKQTNEARVSLEQYLQMTGEHDGPQTQQARRLLDSLPGVQPASPLAPSDRPTTEAGALAPAPTPVVSTTRPTDIVVTPQRKHPPSALPTKPESSSTKILIGTGALLLIGGGTLWWWADDVATEARDKMAALDDAAPSRRVTSQEQLDQVVAYARERSKQETTADDAERLRWLGITSGAIGLAALAAGTYLGYWGSDRVSTRIALDHVTWTLKW